MSQRAAALVWCPFADEASAADTASRLLDDGLVVCANIVPAIRSLYVWNGKRSEGHEVGVLFKTSALRLDAVISRLEAIHPYDAPAITGWICDATGPKMLAWLDEIAGPTAEPER